MWGFSVENEPKQKNDEPCIGQEAEGWIFLYVLMFGQGHFTHNTSGMSWKCAGMEVFSVFCPEEKRTFCTRRVWFTVNTLLKEKRKRYLCEYHEHTITFGYFRIFSKRKHYGPSWNLKIKNSNLFVPFPPSLPPCFPAFRNDSWYFLQFSGRRIR